MKLSTQLNDALNAQVQKEYLNMLRYKQIASHFEDLQLKNIAKYFHDQADEENEHANKFIAHINDRVSGKVDLEEVQKPIINMNNIPDEYLSIEEETTNSIEGLYDMAFEEKSFIDIPFLSEMLSIQKIEEDEAQEFGMKLKMVKDLVLFDASLGE